IANGVARAEARDRAGRLLRRLNIPERLWPLPPSTFSGGEQQRFNIARGFISDLPILLLDEPTASLDAVNRAVVVDLIDEKKRAGVAMVAIVHDDEIRQLIADRVVDVTSFAAAAWGRPEMTSTGTGSETVIGNARIVLAERIIERGWIAFAGGRV